MSLIRNEQTKLTASWLNAISAASIAVGGFAQLAPLLSGVVVAPRPVLAATFSAIWFGIGGSLHVMARRTLRGLVE